MRLSCILSSVAAATIGAASASSRCPPFPSSMIAFSSEFQQPEPPLVKPEFRTQFIQHKWDQNVSHIMTGYIENSPAKGFVRVNEVFDDKLATSLFNHHNVTKEGLVDNTLTTYDPAVKKPNIWRGYVNSNYPIFAKDILITAGAVFEGLVQRNFNEGLVAAWSIMYQGAIPVTVFVNSCHVVVGYDYFSPGLRTRVVTEFFNTRAEA
ncbi:hypothetical protein B0T10DRAFT_465949 [Thelonectria olida]|uniref:Uncharacterized protein n=1 Tax=Thelonectria olida TaxID=1576542 RepID=A0A9P8VUV7_9HYPO|nr:hypothetical protein B0T10DRAFT_465949 [Thelonectria olida]